MIGKVIWYDVSVFKFAGSCFVAYHMIYDDECFMSTWEECVFFWNRMLYLSGIFDLKYVSSSTFPCLFYILMIFPLLNVGYWSFLLFIVVYLFRSVSICLIYLIVPILVGYIFIKYLDDLTFVSRYHFGLKVCFLNSFSFIFLFFFFGSPLNE